MHVYIKLLRVYTKSLHTLAIATKKVYTQCYALYI